MASLKLEDLMKKRTEIIKAEIGALLFNLGKTHVGFWGKYFNVDANAFEKKYGYPVFTGYKYYFKPYVKGNDETRFERDIKNIDQALRDFFYETKVDLVNDQNIYLSDIIYCDALEKTGRPEVEKFVKNIFFHGCENINSGIDKGPPPDKQQLKELWISNAFGSFKKEMSRDMLDEERLSFLQSLWKKIGDMNKKPEDFSHEDWVELRNFVFSEVKRWYSNLLSDSRFPANDVTLWDQAYMTASLFKASLAATQLDNSRLDDYKHETLCRKIKWSILGIQYDKLGLAEKALKAPYIDWYRDAVNEVDNKIKKIIETDYAFGNEIYRDETGIYFIVPENAGVFKDSSDYFCPLSKSLQRIQDEISRVFSNKFNGEIYPSISVAKPSRGIMNLAYLLEESKNNFLKAYYPKNFEEICSDKEQASHKDVVAYNGLCQICKFRLAKKNNEDLMVCDKCNDKEHKRLKRWTENLNGETIWTGELQDENGRIALVTLKFELQRWLNADMLNTSVKNILDGEEPGKYLTWLKNTLHAIKEIKGINGFDIDEYKKKLKDKELEEFIKAVDGILDKYSINSEFAVSTSIAESFNIDYTDYTFKPSKKAKPQNLNNIVNNTSFQTHIKKFDFEIFLELAKDAYKPFMHKRIDLNFEDFLAEVFLERSLGDRWETFINDKLKGKVDFNSGKILWDKLNEDDIDFLANILFQFLIRKNPSPARLRRIWETTREFFAECNKKLKYLLGIEDWRCKRLVWCNAIAKQEKMEKEYSYKGLDFLADDSGNVYLISSIEKALPIIAKKEAKKDIAGTKSKIDAGDTDWVDDISFQDYDTGHDAGIKLKGSDAVYETYLPYISIINLTPISWQFIVPAQYVPEMILKIQEEYNKEFKYVVGKLPLHIGVVIQDYKKPLYMGIKALRKIRRDIPDRMAIQTEDKVNNLEMLQEKIFRDDSESTRKAIKFEEKEDTAKYYSLYPTTGEQSKYQFYISPEDKASGLCVVDFNSRGCDGDVITYPNTIDFEFLDVNSRRNDIHYFNGKRKLREKMNRPYSWQEWELFKHFAEYFNQKDRERNTKLHHIVNSIFSKLNHYNDNEKIIQSFNKSLFINTLDLDGDGGTREKDEFAKILLLPHERAKAEDSENVKWDDLNKIDPHVFKNCLLRFIDMYEFWHTALKWM